jgi:hypothetical protein
LEIVIVAILPDRKPLVGEGCPTDGDIPSTPRRQEDCFCRKPDIVQTMPVAETKTAGRSPPSRYGLMRSAYQSS